MSKAPRASIVISSYNYARFLGEAIDSALCQTWPQTEVIVVDDGSTDESKEVIREFGQRIIPILKENGGQASALNRGWQVSTGDIVLFLDSDDVLLSTAVETAAQFLADPSVAKVHWPMLEIDDQGRKNGRMNPTRPLGSGSLREHVIQNGPGCYTVPPTSGNCWSRWLLDRIFPIPEEDYITCPDGYLAALAPLFGNLQTVAEPQTFYRVHGENNWDKLAYGTKKTLFANRCRDLSNCLRKQGIVIDPEVWKSRPYYQWLEQMHSTTGDLLAVVPKGSTIILVDEEHFREDLLPCWNTIPFLEKDGKYSGRPQNDGIAIWEFDRLRRGAQYMIFAWPAFWWLNYYTGLHEYLRAKFNCVLRNERLVIFDLK